MKITIYELLGLIKDGKAPKKIKVTGRIYDYDEKYEFYYTKSNKANYNVSLGGLEDEINLIANAFNENVEIIEEVEDKGYEDIEKITDDEWAEITYKDSWELLQHDFNLNARTFNDKINALIRNQKKIIEQLKGYEK